jgi:Na+/phosphate symporter
MNSEITVTIIDENIPSENIGKIIENIYSIHKYYYEQASDREAQLSNYCDILENKIKRLQSELSALSALSEQKQVNSQKTYSQAEIDSWDAQSGSFSETEINRSEEW